ncbi:MAG: anthranilate phosphoribosyltransferase [Cytophagales bacterium]|nr:anthranilate phosphoribosyltransferase [Cytophagales bacterium]
MKKILNELFEYKTLSKASAREVLTQIARGEFKTSQIAAFLTIYQMRSITVEELSGFREAMLELCLPVDLGGREVIDLCGTGGDGKDTFNISTLASFVTAGAGQPVAKHGNKSVSSVCGSSNVMEYFGYRFTNEESKLQESLEKANICFLHAPLFHPAMKNVAPIRQELGVKTFFNMLGPMVNPSFPKKQLVGVFSLELARLYGYLYQQTDKDYMILHALDGYDEISLTSDFKMITRQEEKIVSSKELGLGSYQQSEIHGGNTVKQAAAIFENILKGEGTKAQSDVVIANAGMAIYCSNPSQSLERAVASARESLESGRAYASFKNLLAVGS